MDPYTGEIFNVPNFCICDPIYKKIIKQETFTEEKKIKIELLYVFKNLSHFIQISNKCYGKDIKKTFCELEKIESEKHQIRLLSKGQEIKDDIQIYNYNLQEKDKIQVMCRNLEEE